MSDVLDAKSRVENPDLGIDDRKQLAGSLAKIVADTYVLLVKTQGYHWNVVGRCSSACTSSPRSSTRTCSRPATSSRSGSGRWAIRRRAACTT
jgi:hypothetical protein